MVGGLLYDARKDVARQEWMRELRKDSSDEEAWNSLQISFRKEPASELCGGKGKPTPKGQWTPSKSNVTGRKAVAPGKAVASKVASKGQFKIPVGPRSAKVVAALQQKELKAANKEAVAAQVKNTGSKTPRCRRKKKNPEFDLSAPPRQARSKEPRWAQEVRYYQKRTGMLIPHRPFMRLIRELAQEHKTDVRFQLSALMALQAASEHFLTMRMEMANDSTIHAKRATILVKDWYFPDMGMDYKHHY